MLLILILICYLSCLIIGTVNDGLIYSTNGRMFNSIGALISIIIIYIYVKTNIFNEKIFRKIIEMVIVIYFIINLINTIYVTKQFRSYNDKDRQIFLKIS